MNTRTCGLFLLSLIAGCLFAGEKKWVSISDAAVKEALADGKKQDWPEGTAGVVVDPANGDVYMIVTGKGIWKSSDQGATFARADKGEIGGRCETGFTLNMDPAGGGRLACFMLDGKGGMTLDGGKTWSPFAPMGRNWDYAAVDWSPKEPKNIFAARHEMGGEHYLSTDAGAHWTKLGADKAFDNKGGAGIFDDKTLVMTKGDGILRSTDAGATWTKISDLTPNGRVVKVFKNVAYWLSAQGLLVSSDKGATWKVQGSPTDATLGPWFKDENNIAAAGKSGAVISTDGGKTWTNVAPLPEKFALPKAGWYANVAWDPVHDIFYASQMGKPTYRLEKK
ncbi:MAG TPA: hypothetical protein VKX17_17215 [Planctomycetota bacterium]|nr:hypothetical protein [Planctomycetota bacterium]